MHKTKHFILLFLSFLIFTTTLSAKPKQNLGYFDYEGKTFGDPYQDEIKGWIKEGYTDICFKNSFLGGSTKLNKYFHNRQHNVKQCILA